MRYLTLALLALACTPLPEDTPRTVERYSGTWRYYDVDAKETIISGRCVERVITLKATNRLHPAHIVQHVRATDRDCDDQLDHLYFRYEDDRMKAGGRLHMDVIQAFHVVRR